MQAGRYRRPCTTWKPSVIENGGDGTTVEGFLRVGTRAWRYHSDTLYR